MNRTYSGRFPPNQQEIYPNIIFSSDDELSSDLSVNTENFVSFTSEPIEDAPPAYDTITRNEDVPRNIQENTSENISEEQILENTDVVDVNYITT
ncbi:12190_t:CDS:2, partial [Cetraspora pellucida]